MSLNFFLCVLLSNEAHLYHPNERMVADFFLNPRHIVMTKEREGKFLIEPYNKGRKERKRRSQKRW